MYYIEPSEYSLAELANMLIEATEAEAIAKEAHAEAFKALEHLRKYVIPLKFEEELPGVTSVKLDGIGNLRIDSDAYVTVPASERETLQEWLVKTGHAELIQPTVNPSTLKAFVKSCIRDGIEISNAVNVTPYQVARLTKK